MPPELYQELDNYINQFDIQPRDPRKKEFLIQCLHKAQDIFGYLPEEIQLHVANKLSIHHAEVSGVISFYNYFTTTPKGKFRVNVCMGTACYVKGADKVLLEFERVLGIKSGEVTPDQNFSIESLRCVGACGLAPVVMINEKVYGKVKTEQVREILEHYFVELG
ncbi:NAD(P)H-dependent oxidoreductase subunit E [candidate division KSB3 bacterium]|uniref:NAD(P)H-dependent oxidoreductase subunit E n=1 Tax=candidate division KSB3 bacterium TaxID=2044937 RepID=A0A2G6EAQ3_9BACT|nr:MAG: NAD(P)H-dependent oxidoreductase subunit E [candidate division KSB3 bacterium]PIE30833.1 MAG: NAD(P)H-dependent oxidoreductase subunit E [candidate division KSB3 bacterium]